MLVRDVMIKKVHSVKPSDCFREIIRVLVKNKISGVPVLNKNGKVVGIISEKDLFIKLFPSEKHFYKNIEYYMNYENITKDMDKVESIKANKIMEKEIISIGSDENILKACSLMMINNIRRLPVIDNGKLVGIVTTNNIFKNFLNSLIESSN